MDVLSVRQMVQAQGLVAPAHQRRVREDAQTPVQSVSRVLLPPAQPEDPFHQQTQNPDMTGIR